MVFVLKSVTNYLNTNCDCEQYDLNTQAVQQTHPLKTSYMIPKFSNNCGFAPFYFISVRFYFPITLSLGNNLSEL